jgi:hypothetical protein
MTGGTIGTSPLGSQTFPTIVNDSLDKLWLGRVRVAVAIVAQEVTAEASTVTNDADRQALAQAVLKYQLPQVTEAFALAALTDLTTTRSSTDQDLLTRIEAIWDQIAG